VTRPRLLDLFCGAGGAAVGYHRAGFDVVGVDIAAQPNYPFEFHQADALDPPVLFDEFDAIHASPPCQAYSRATAWSGDRSAHPDLIGPVQEMLRATGLLYVIENVQEARWRLHGPLMVCGTGVGLPVRRHRYFELSWDGFWMRAPCQHRATDFSHDHGTKQSEAVYRDAMGCEWMTVHEAREAIPPAYTEHIGGYLMAEIRARKVAT
jgi:site-specific DNA-cytosine methylase